MKYDDFEKVFEEGGRHEEFEEGNGPWEAFSHLFGCIDPEEWETKFAREFEREIPKFVEKMARFGNRFGRMGEDMSRHFHESRSQRDEEIQVILEMLKDGKITAEEAEKLINAVKGRKTAT